MKIKHFLLSIVLFCAIQTVSAQELRKNGSSFGKIESDGTIRKNGSSVGKVESDGTVRINGSSVGKIESDGTVRKNGSSIGSASGVRKEYAAVLFFFDFFN